MRDPGVQGPSAARWNQTALIWVAAFWAPIVGAYVHLLAQAPDRLAANAALVYVAVLAVGLAALTAACVGAHALLILVVRWLAHQPDAWRRPAGAGLSVAVGWLLAYLWTTWATRLAHAFTAPQPLPDALARAVGLGIALAYLVVGLGVAGAPLLALLPARPAGASVAARVPAPTASAPRAIAPKPYPITTTAAPPAAAPAIAIAVSPPVRAAATPPALDTPLVLRYPPRAAAPPAPAPPAFADSQPRVVPVVMPRAEPRTVPVLPPA